MPLIMVMLRFALQSFQLSLTLNQFQIHTPLQLNQLMIMKWNIYWNYSIQNMTKIFWMLTSIYFRLNWWFPLLKSFIESLSTVLFHKYGGANVSVTNWMSHFSMFVPTKDTVKLSNGNTGHSQGIGIILCHFPNCSIIYPVGPVYYCPGHPSNTNIQWDQFIIVHVTLPTPSHQVPSNFMLAFKILHLNLLNIVTLLTLKVVLGDQPTRLKKSTIFISKLSNSTLTEIGILLSQLSVHLKKKLSIRLFISVLVMSLLTD